MTTESHGIDALVPPQLPPFLANVFSLQPIVGNPSREEVKLVHEVVRALNNFPHMPELRNTDLSIELAQHLFDIQMTCHRHKYPTSILPSDVVYDPPTLPVYIPIELKSITGPPSNAEVAAVHTALRISESFVNAPSIFDPDLHVELSQHLFDIQLARHVQRSIVKRLAPVTPALQNQAAPYSNPGASTVDRPSETQDRPSATPDHTAEPAETQNPPLEQPNPSIEAAGCQTPNEITELIVEIRDILKNGNQIAVGTQNSLARGFNSSSFHIYQKMNISHDLGSHSLINDHGEVPEKYDLPTFKYGGNCCRPSFAIKDLTENQLARYLRFYSIGEEMIEEGEELKIKSDRVDDARVLLSRRLFLIR